MGKESIAVIGSGLMGHGIAQIFASHGHSVSIMDQDEARLHQALEHVEQNLDTMREHAISFDDDNSTILSRIETHTDMALACEGKDFVFEAVFEDMALKQSIFAELDSICLPETILCSNTSVMSITEIASKSVNRERIVGTHFWNPPYLIPLVEVVKADDSSQEVIDKTYDLLKSVGKKAVKVNRDVPGFVGNRLQHALWREAFAIIDEGICDAETVDEVIKSGPGLRWPILGPMENADMVGLDLSKAIHDYILPHINADPTPSKTLLELVDKGDLGFKSGQGFQTWSEEDIDASRKQLSNYLLKAQAERN